MADTYVAGDKVNQRLLDYQTILVPANGVITYNGNFSTVSIISITQAGIEQPAGVLVAAIQDQSESSIFGGMYFETQNQINFAERCTFRNTTAVATQIIVVFGSGKTEDRRLQLSGSITLAANTTILTSSGATVATGRVSVGALTAIVAANSSRRRVTIKSLSTNTDTVYLGDVAVTTANGHALEIGDAVTFDTTGAISAIPASGSQVVTYLSEAV